MNAINPAAVPQPAAGGPVRMHLLAAALLMLACLALAALMKPNDFWADKVGAPDLEGAVPKRFGDWEENPYGAQAVVNPQQEEAIRAIYNSTVARAYIHKPTGRQMMLSLAYGKDQSRDTQLHPPEACYGGNGFRIMRLEPVELPVQGLQIPAMRMDAVMGLRHEYVTYWIRVGDRLARGSLQRNLVRMRFAAQGYIADGLLFRVSEVTRDRREESYRLQDEFMRALLAEVARAGAMDQFVGRQLP